MPSTIGIVASASIGFTPASLTNIVAWWDASDASTFTYGTGTAVSEWASKIGGYKLVQSTANKQPDRSGTINGLTCVVFDGSNDSMSTSTTVDLTSGGQKFSVFAVATSAAGGTNVLIEQSADYNASLGTFVLFHETTNTMQFSKSGTATTYSAVRTTSTLTTAAKSLIGTHDGTLSTNESNIYLNNAVGQTYVINNNTNDNNRNLTLFVGARNNASFFWSGNICELGVTAAVMTSTERSDLQTYLAAKWGL